MTPGATGKREHQGSKGDDSENYPAGLGEAKWKSVVVLSNMGKRDEKTTRRYGVTTVTLCGSCLEAG